MGNVIKKIFPKYAASYEYEYMNRPPTSENINLSKNLRIPPPVRPSDEYDSAKIHAYYYSSNICWLFAFIISIFVIGITVGVLDSGLHVSWTSQGSKGLNDRHVPISSVWSKTIDLKNPSFIVNWTNSTTVTPAIWDGLVFYASWDGKVVAIDEHSGDVVWLVNICTDVYAFSTSFCAVEIKDRRYITVATPTVWGGNIVLSILKPADIVVLNQKTGGLVQMATLATNPLASLTQSGTVWDDFLIIGSTISDSDASLDSSNCSFIGRLWKWDLKNNVVIWVTNMEDPLNIRSTRSGFTGMPIRGSSPALSIKHGLVAISVGGLVCTPNWYDNCVSTVNCTPGPNNFNYTAYQRRYEDCDNTAITSTVIYDSIAVFRLEDGSLYWHEKLNGQRAWHLACDGFNQTNPCESFAEVDDCDFYHDPTINCRTERNSCNNVYQFVDDPVLQIHSNGDETLYAMQHSGIIFSFDMLKRDDPTEQIHWARAVSRGFGAGGVAVDKANVYFSLFNELGSSWIYDVNGSSTDCGGWGAIDTSNGLPVWYRPHPMCGKYYFGCDGNLSVNPVNTGGQSAPSVTNDIVLVTSDDTSIPFWSNWDESNPHCGGHIYAFEASTGKLISSYETKSPFGEQGVSIHARCVYVGNGPNPNILKTAGKNLYGWCVPQAYPLKLEP